MLLVFDLQFVMAQSGGVSVVLNFLVQNVNHVHIVGPSRYIPRIIAIFVLTHNLLY